MGNKSWGHGYYTGIGDGFSDGYNAGNKAGNKDSTLKAILAASGGIVAGTVLGSLGKKSKSQSCPYCGSKNTEIYLSKKGNLKIKCYDCGEKKKLK